MRALALVSREWRSAWTDRGSYILRGVYAGLLLAGAAWAWIVLTMFDTASPGEFPGYVRGIFDAFCRIQFGLATLFASMIFSRAVCREQERGTLDFLVLCRLSGTEILAGKLAGEFLGVAALMLAGLPMFFLLLPLGGVSVTEILCVQGVVLAQALLAGGLCVAFAALIGRTLPVMLSAGIVMALYLGGPAIGRSWEPRWRWTWAAWDGISTWDLLDRELSGVRPDPWPVLGALAAAAVVSLMLCGIGSLVLERRHVRGPKPSLLGPLVIRVRRFFATPRKGLLSTVLIRVDHPLTRRECAVDRGLWFRILWVAYVAAYALGLMRAIARGWEAHGELVGVGLLAAITLTVLQGTFSVAADRRRGMLETLLASGIAPEDLVRSRVAGLLLRAGYFMVLPVAHLIVLAIGSREFPGGELAWRIPIGLVGILMGTIVMAQLTIWSALRRRRPEVAAVESLIFATLAAAGTAGTLGAHVLSFFVFLPLVIAGVCQMHVKLIQKIPLWVLR